MEQAEIDGAGPVLDPCCGTGGFLLALAERGVSPAKLFGQDRDPLAAALARINLALTGRVEDPALLLRNIRCADSLHSLPAGPFSAVVGNPPWGGALSGEERAGLRARYAAAAQKRPDSAGLFVECALGCLAPGGTLTFVLPQALLHVEAHRPVREMLLERAGIVRLTYLDNVFSGVQCPSVILTAVRDRDSAVTLVTRGKERYRVGARPAGRFSYHIRDDEYACLQAAESCPGAAYLRGSARFALGIVTGNNRRHLLSGPEEGAEPVLRGGDVLRFRTKEPSSFLRYEPEKLQQVAPEAVYRAPEKLVYRFVGGGPVFAYDNRQTLSLNSCNILIPQMEGLPVKYVLAALNSRAARFYCMRKFRSLKLLRSHLEQIPIPGCTAAEQGAVLALTDAILAGEGDAASLYEELDGLMMELYALGEAHRRLIRESLAGEKLHLPGEPAR